VLERKSRVMLAATLAGKTAAETISVMLAVFARIGTLIAAGSSAADLRCASPSLSTMIPLSLSME
jgi:hypothetical protein